MKRKVGKRKKQLQQKYFFRRLLLTEGILIIAAVILVCGLGFSNGLTFTIGGTSITLTALAIAAIAGVLLNAILPGKDYEFGKDPQADKNRGLDMNFMDNK